MTITEVILSEINEKRLTQADVAKTCAFAISNCMKDVDWKSVNEAIKARWSPSARERVLTMAWKIVERHSEVVKQVSAVLECAA